MKNFFIILSVSLFILVSCKKETTQSGTTVKNKPPVANAGEKISITLPEDSVVLNGSASSDPDNNIVSYSWRKIFGPDSFILRNTNAAQTTIVNLIKGSYEFELEVTDRNGLSDKDTVEIEVRPEVNLQCFYFPDPTGTISPVSLTFDSEDISTALITVTINDLFGKLSGVWGKNYSPICPINFGYNIDQGVNYAIFNLPPGTYNWSAESSIVDMTGCSGVTGPFIQYFLTAHKTQGTITVNSGDNCIIQKIVFP